MSYLRRCGRQAAVMLYEWCGRLRVANPDIDDADWRIIKSVRQHTMVSTARLAATIDAVRYVCRVGVPGVLVEVGVWRGGSLAAMWLASDGTRAVWGYDTFSGIPRPGPHDTTRVGWQQAITAWQWRRSWLEASRTEVARNMAAVHCEYPRLRLVEGDVTVGITAMPESIAVLRIDCDWYDSVRACLHALYPRVSPGGVVLIDDYGHWDGARKAVDEYFGGRMLLHRTDYTGRVLVKA